MHILAIRFSSLGDVVLQTSWISWIKMSYPDCKITFLTAKEFTQLVIGHDHLDEVIGMPRFKGLKGVFELKNFVQKLNEEKKFDLIFDLHGTTRSFFVKLFLPFVKSISLDKRRLERFLLVNAKWDLLKDQKSIHSRNHYDFSHILSDGLDELELTNFVNSSSNTSKRLGLTSSPLVFHEEQKQNNKYIILSPVASFTPKRWPVENFYELAKNILEDKLFEEFKLYVLAGPNDHFCEVFNTLEIQFQGRFENLQGKTTLIESMQYLKNCALCVGNDTGLNHIAEASGNPVITIFGPTHESLGFKAHLEKSRNLSVDLKCRPCSTTGKKPCKFNEQICMTQITPQFVLENMKEMIQGR